MYVSRVFGRGTKLWAGALCATVSTGLAACGGTDPSPDIDETGGSYPVDVRASYPDRQRVSLTSDLVLRVRNDGDRAIPQLTVTVWTGETGVEDPKPEDPFSILADDARSGDRAARVWVPVPGFPKVVPEGERAADLPDDGPAGGAQAAQTDTFTFGRLEAGDSRTLVWRTTAVRAGRYAVNYAVAAGVGGDARAEGASAVGRIPVRITAAPAGCVVDREAPAEGCGAD